MKKTSILGSLAALVALSCGASAQEQKPKTKAEMRLAKMLEGRTAGTGKSCITVDPNAQMTVLDGTAIVYRIGSTVYVNTTARPRDIDSDDVLVIRRMGSQLCRTDIVTTIDRMGGFFSGTLFLTDFVPYKKVAG